MNSACAFDIDLKNFGDVIRVYLQNSFNAIDSGASKRPSCLFVDFQRLGKCRDRLGNLLLECLSRRFVFRNINFSASVL